MATTAISAPTALVTPTGTATARPTNTSTPRALPTRAGSPTRVISATLRPQQVTAGGGLTATVTTSGPVGRVEMYVSAGPGGAAPLVLTLSSNGAGIWSSTAQAPATPGQYHFTVGIFVNGVRSIVDNDGWNIKVSGGSSSGSGPATMPSDVPLAPPFSYGSPVPAVFSAEGKTVSGSEVVSTARTDVSGAAVSQWYEVHFPRAGWTVDAATVPSAGASVFSLVATAGQRVCVVEYSASTVHVFYGTLPS